MAEFNRLAPFTARYILTVAGVLKCDYRELSPLDQATEHKRHEHAVLPRGLCCLRFRY